LDLAASKTFKMVAGRLESIDDFQLAGGSGGATENILEAGTVVDGKFQILSVLGQGGMGAVYRAFHLTLHKYLALKTFYSKDVDEQNWQRFLLEARLIARLQDPRIVNVFDYGHGVGGKPYYTMELLEGESLAERIVRKGKLPLSEALPIFAAVAEGLASAHAQGVIHRDLKPGNIFIVCDLVNSPDKIQGVKIVDFGIAKIAGVAGGGEADQVEQGLTEVGVIFGSPLYMSPEQASGLPVDARSDIYSFGCALFEALTGRPPFKRPNAIATILAHSNEVPPSLAQASPGTEYPEWLEILMSRLLAKRKEMRLKTCGEIPHIFSYESKRTSLTHSPASAGGLAVNPARGPVDDIEGKPPIGAGKIALIALVTVLFTGALFGGYFLFLRHAPPVVVDKPITAPPTDDEEAAYKPLDLASTPREFFKGTKSNGKQTVQLFDFGKQDFGFFYVNNKVLPIRCFGQTTVPVGAHFCFWPNYLFVTNPELFERFAPGSIDRIRFDVDQEKSLSANPNTDSQQWGLRHLKAITRFDKLCYLNICKTQIGRSCLSELNKLSALRELEISGSALTGPDLLKLKYLPEMTGLVAGHVEGILEFVRAKEFASLHLASFSVKDCAFTDDDLKRVCQLKTLQFLFIDLTQVTDNGLRYLQTLPRLQSVSVSSPNLTPRSFVEFAKLKHLVKLDLSMEQASHAEIQKFVGEMAPRCRVNFSEKKPALDAENLR
jgi:serine/threonine protein kinase